jgi:CelD/BcsL family acetyltransferase involved in cellulose biosynthesis
LAEYGTKLAGAVIDILEPALKATDATLYEVDPTKDARWETFLQRTPQASIFHSSGWLEALKLTYGYLPVAFTTSAPNEPLSNAIPFCRINGLFGRQRLVSLPFSDHCQPLADSAIQLQGLMLLLQQKRDADKWSYLELRPKNDIAAAETELSRSQLFAFHRLDLRPNPDEIFGKLHKSCVQRKIRRAEKVGLTYKSGVSDRLLHQFYELLLMTRRRHGIPVQPFDWFKNLIDTIGANLTIRVALINQQPVASILTLRHKQTLFYKYGCSDRAFSRFGGMQMLLWRAILEAKADGLLEFDLGRSDSGNPGLVAFKDRWGARRTQLSYFRYPIAESQRHSHPENSALSKYLWSHAPNGILTAAGRMLYKHMG